MNGFVTALEVLARRSPALRTAISLSNRELTLDKHTARTALARGGYDDRINAAVERLAQEVYDQWRAEEERRSVHDPFVLPVRWQNAPNELSDDRSNILDLPARATESEQDLGNELVNIVEPHQAPEVSPGCWQQPVPGRLC